MYFCKILFFLSCFIFSFSISQGSVATDMLPHENWGKFFLGYSPTTREGRQNWGLDAKHLPGIQSQPRYQQVAGFLKTRLDALASPECIAYAIRRTVAGRIEGDIASCINGTSFAIAPTRRATVKDIEFLFSTAYTIGTAAREKFKNQVDPAFLDVLSHFRITGDDACTKGSEIYRHNLTLAYVACLAVLNTTSQTIDFNINSIDSLLRLNLEIGSTISIQNCVRPYFIQFFGTVLSPDTQKTRSSLKALYTPSARTLSTPPPQSFLPLIQEAHLATQKTSLPAGLIAQEFHRALNYYGLDIKQFKSSESLDVLQAVIQTLQNLLREERDMTSSPLFSREELLKDLVALNFLSPSQKQSLLLKAKKMSEEAQGPKMSVNYQGKIRILYQEFTNKHKKPGSPQDRLQLRNFIMQRMLPNNEAGILVETLIVPNLHSAFPDWYRADGTILPNLESDEKSWVRPPIPQTVERLIELDGDSLDPFSDVNSPYDEESAIEESLRLYEEQQKKLLKKEESSEEFIDNDEDLKKAIEMSLQVDEKKESTQVPPPEEKKPTIRKTSLEQAWIEIQKFNRAHKLDSQSFEATPETIIKEIKLKKGSIPEEIEMAIQVILKTKKAPV